MFKEYPKWVTPPNGKPLIVKDANEEALVMAVPIQIGDVVQIDGEPHEVVDVQPRRRGRPPRVSNDAA